MKSNSTHFVHQTAKAALITTVALALLVPSGLAGAASKSITATASPSAVSVKPSSSEASTADQAKVKFTKEQAIAKLKELFPVLKDASVSHVELGSNNSYPAPANQMVWNIQWEYRVGNGGYGFGSQVDAITGDLINTYISFPLLGNENYYPPKLSQDQALEKAQAFVAKAVPSIKSSDLQVDDNGAINFNNGALFGPVQYNFNFRLLKNGIPSAADSIMVTIDGSGNVLQFYKQAENLVYPAAQPKITQAQAEKKFTDSLDIGLYYIPVYKGGTVNSWILGWRPVEQALYSIDALTGKTMDYAGTVSSSTPVTYADVPQDKNYFKPKSWGRELTMEEASKLVKLVATIPADRKLISSSLGNDYQNPERKLWRLTWGKNNGYSAGYPQQSYAELDAESGEILRFEEEQFNFQEGTKSQPAPAGGKKLTQKEAKQKALALVSRMYDNASSSLKLMERGGDWSVIPGGKGYRYQFVRYYKGIPISDSFVNVNLDIYGRLQSYNSYRISGIEKITQEPVATITKKEALEQYLGQYKVKLQYIRIGGYTMDKSYITPKVKLVYSPIPVDIKKSQEVIDAVTGKFVSIYENFGQKGSPAAATDLKGHSAEKELSELVKYNVLTPDADGKVNPDQEITVGDWLTFIVKASTPYYEAYYGGMERKAMAGINPESPYYSFVSFAVERGWISRDAVVQADSKLTREQLAVLLTSFVKYSKISVYLEKDTTLSQFSDISSISNKGAIAVAVKLGLLEGANGKFNPQQTVTKAEAAKVIMKLVELQGKTDQTIGQ
ncbi:S-layer homology domain-containing protein [Paenibacillus sp. BR2-3]|uniref:YcdB/YcdC domain-containing protein n=1 Tax=Paenibacillus sp. BR2-3 TaxID=3048494 RepID=UPI003977C11D